MILPSDLIPANLVNPKRMVIFAHTKVGKTEALSKLKNSLLLDLEEGSGFVDAMKIDFRKELSADPQLNPLSLMEKIGEALDKSKVDGKWKYDYIVVDTTTALEQYARKLATVLYKSTPLGKSFAGADVVTDLPQGAGYDWLRKAFNMLLKPIENKCNTCFILVSHVKDASINKQGKDLMAKDINLTGKLKLIICANADAIGYMSRNNLNQTILSFKTHEQDLATGARAPHLANQEFVILELTNPDYINKNERRVFKHGWDKIFI